MRQVFRCAPWCLGSALAVSSCAPPPRPPTMAQVDSVRQSPASQDAKVRAPHAVAHAELLRGQAEHAYEEGRIAEASVLSERALVAFQRAAVLARVVAAADHAAVAQKKLSATADRLRELEAEQRRLEADLDAVQKLQAVVRDAEAVTTSGKADPSREEARRKATRSILADARLLCSAARLVGSSGTPHAAALDELESLERTLDAGSAHAPIDQARRARARCMSLLTLARRSAGRGSDSADVLLERLSSTNGMAPARDERGVIVALRGDVASKENAARIGAIVEAARAHPSFPLLVIGHTSARPSRGASERVHRRADQVANMLRTQGVTVERIQVEFVAGFLPVVHDPVPPPAVSHNERVEVVFVSPGS